MTDIEKEALAAIAGGCPFCSFEHRRVIEAAVICDEMPHVEAVERYGFQGDVGNTAAEIFRLHRSLGHAPSREELAGVAVDYATAEAHAAAKEAAR